MKNSWIFKLIFGLAAASFILVGFFVIKKYLFESKDLTAYLPPETIAYFEFQPHDDKLQEYVTNNDRALTRINEIFQKTGFWGNFNLPLLPESVNKIGYVIVDQEGVWEYLWLIETSSQGSLDIFFPADSFTYYIEKNIVVVSPKRETLNFFKEQNKLSIQTPILKIMFSKFSRHKFFNAFMSPQYIGYIKSSDNNTLKYLLESFELEDTSPAYFSLRSDKQQIVLNFQAATTNVQKNKDIDDYSLDRLAQIPTANVFSASQVSSFKDISDLIEELLLEELGKENFENKKQAFAQKYGFGWGDFYKLVSNPTTLITAIPEARPRLSDILSQDNKKVALAFHLKEKDQSQYLYTEIKRTISSWLAFKYPSNQDVILPDNTSINALVANPDNINWQTKSNIEFFERDGVHVALALKDNDIYMSWDKEFINEILNSAQSHDTIDTCPEFKGSEVTYLNTQKAKNGIFSLVDEIFIYINKKKGGLELNGCLNW